MAVSGTTVFSLDRDELIADSLVDIGAIALGATPTDKQITHAASRLNTIIKAWQGERIFLYAKTTGVINTVGTESTLTGMDGLRRILHAYITVDSTDTNLTKFSQADYDSIKTKAPGAVPTHYYVDEPANKIYLYPVPDAVYPITFRYETILDDMSSATDDFDLPQTALDMIMKTLAYELSVPYGLPMDRVQLAGGRAAKAKTDYLVHANQEFNSTDIRTPKGVNII
jgi:hypothetical protein